MGHPDHDGSITERTTTERRGKIKGGKRRESEKERGISHLSEGRK